MNDAHGHDAGDAVLKALGQVLLDIARSDDVAGRFGGEEFLVYLPAADLKEATMCAERVRTALAGHRFAHLKASERVTASFGVALRRTGETWESLFKRAGQCLYAAKNGGRNRIVTDLEHELMTAQSARISDTFID